MSLARNELANTSLAEQKNNSLENKTNLSLPEARKYCIK